MSRVLVTSRTRMNKGRVCVGGHDLDDDFRSVRLLTKTGLNLPEEPVVNVGDVLDLEYLIRPELDPPHVEDVLVQHAKRVGKMDPKQICDEVCSRPELIWDGRPDELFDGLVAATSSGRVYVPDTGQLPPRSTGYWIPDHDLIQRIAFDKVRFVYAGVSPTDEFSWAGVAAPPERIVAGTLVRVSLARWYNPPTAPSGYYVQISGVYLP